ncbi:hypothetical protein GUITHDRAFT_139904 [Guillardia theta CCMP2712]|uniref:C2 domain-containing protein n=1 Tax=Guillardia theta (strain CCMP2712) TaxID=905079 RepID=L1J7T1_GUITC|nr:hypothetical protein GUITHDRAFT_139904 [Guillardia theta CCMP2712]EKX44372.1 hypothetical protein GUITHDRAFT_139904 [Guillardia theta CCMP2712]|eukprot:XP_005831352.1 hypothetical protein GUITHDRAFT_139904 [Guillardia theta CCMP2712]
MRVSFIVQLHQANLASSISKNPLTYAEFHYDSQRHRSSTRLTSSGPEWNEIFFFDMVGDDSPTLSVSLHQVDKDGNGDKAGECNISLSDLRAELTSERWFELTSSTSSLSSEGEVGCGICLSVQHVDGQKLNDMFKSKMPRSVPDERMLKKLAEQGKGFIEVSVVGGQNFFSVQDSTKNISLAGNNSHNHTHNSSSSHSSSSGNMDCYAQVRVGGESFTSRVMKKSSSPFWNERFSFAYEQLPGMIEIDVKERRQDGDRVVGTCMIRIDELPAGEEVQRCCILRLRDGRRRWNDRRQAVLRVAMNLFQRSSMKVEVPRVDVLKVKEERASSGRGACSIVVLAASIVSSSYWEQQSSSFFIELLTNETRTYTYVDQHLCSPTWNSPFLIDLEADAQVVQVVVKRKSSSLDQRKQDAVVAQTSLVLADMFHQPHAAWYELRGEDGEVAASIRLLTHMLCAPRLKLNYPHRNVHQMKMNDAKGIGCLEVIVVAARDIPVEKETGRRETTLAVKAGRSKMVIEGRGGSNPVWNHPVALDIDYGVRNITIEVRRREDI